MVKIKSDFEQNKQKLTAREKYLKFYNGTIKNMSSIRQILIWYVLISIIGALLLWAPFTHTSDFKDLGSVSFIDSLFVSASAFSDTGLSPLDISDTFNILGQAVTLILLSIGGVGWFTIKIFILQYILRRKTSYQSLSDAASEVGTNRKSETLGLIFSAVIISVVATITFGLIFMVLFATTEMHPYAGVVIDESQTLIGNWGASFWTGIYHASTSVNNSGLDIFPGSISLGVYYGGANGITIQVFTIMLFVIGGIGFGVFYDFWEYLRHRSAGRAFSFSLITKISVLTYVIVALVGLVLAYASEGIAFLVEGDDSLIGQLGGDGAAWWSITFNTFSTRNAGYATVNLGELQDSTKLLYSVMMFIGSGPGSTAGGLRTTTVAVLMVVAWTSMRGYKNYSAFNRQISTEIARQAIIIFIASLVLITSESLIIGLSEAIGHRNTAGYDVSFIDHMFTVFSAFGTTGLATTDLAAYNTFSKLMLIILMFLGQMGMSTTLSQFKSRKVKFQKEFIEEQINLG